MKKALSTVGHWLARHDRLSSPVLLVMALVIGILGVYFLNQSHAATPATSAEVEEGAITSPAQSVSDATASGGKAVRFTSASVVDASTLDHKFMMGYQGWFLCPGDGAPPNRWVHWFSGNVTSDPHTDMWPDMSEADADERCNTGLTKPDGSPAYLYSAYNAKTVARHFAWMQQHHLDGVMLQRFSSELSDPKYLAFRNKVAQNVKAGAEQYGRTFTIMYDVSGQNPATVVSTIENDWKMLVDTLQVTSSDRYLHHRGKPLVSIYGFGYADNPGTAAEVSTLIDFFHANSNPAYQASVMLSVPRTWRTDSYIASNGYLPAFAKADVMSAWAVGGSNSDASVDSYYNNVVKQDIAYTKSKGQDFAPVVFPGFSWYNLKNGASPFNQIPRRGGALFWRQVYDAQTVGATMLYGAMFDEVDEGTAMYKTAATAADQPTQYQYLPLDIDGINLPSDWYLRLGDYAGRSLRGEIPLSPTMPITPSQ